MNDQRSTLALVAGGAAAALGISGWVSGLAVLGAVAGALGLAVALCIRLICHDGAAARAQLSSMSEQMARLEEALATQVQARMAADDTVRSLGEQLAEAQRHAATRVDVPHPSLEDAPSGSLIDPATGLFNESYFRVTVDSRVAAARRHLRPVAVVLLEVTEGLRSDTPRPAEPELVARSIAATLREADTACRVRADAFGLVLEDTSENGAIWTVERLRRRIAAENSGLTLRAGIACYPAHAFGAAELVHRCEEALVAARDWNQDRIEVATID